MIGNSSVLAAVLTVVSVVSLSLLSVLCLRCKKKNKIIHEEHQIYDPQIFQRGGSVFAVTQSKTVTRANQITLSTYVNADTQRPVSFIELLILYVVRLKIYETYLHKKKALIYLFCSETTLDLSTDAIESDYQNVDSEHGDCQETVRADQHRASNQQPFCDGNRERGYDEHTYVDPIAISVYENDKQTTRGLSGADETPAVYGNIITSLSIKEDDDDYENSDFLEQIAQEQEDDEPDYVNENG
ncbi:uncharacterized protein LOC131986646 isoform X1 [Centropristis striata]|uniref:uncharacterized protein LOC131986646 isoform X1 n=1 Tax=Centropristis striata TaxID=184440 RepID=UPI0027E00CFD|nr:uncharacterized protein LOC131986646 isoform X1 [Centropristis striata]